MQDSPATRQRTCCVCQTAIERGSDHLACVLEMISEAVQNGTHAARTRQFCGVCREWVDVIYHIGFDGTRMCPVCADKCGQGPKADAERINKHNAKPVAKGYAGNAGKDAPHGRGAPTDGRFISSQPWTEAQRRQRCPVAAVQDVDWGEEVMA